MNLVVILDSINFDLAIITGKKNLSLAVTADLILMSCQI
jgi:hypothetical protein